MSGIAEKAEEKLKDSCDKLKDIAANLKRQGDNCAAEVSRLHYDFEYICLNFDLILRGSFRSMDDHERKLVVEAEKKLKDTCKKMEQLAANLKRQGHDYAAEVGQLYYDFEYICLNYDLIPRGHSTVDDEAVSPDRIASALRRMATALDKSKAPSRDLVMRDLRLLVNKIAGRTPEEREDDLADAADEAAMRRLEEGRLSDEERYNLRKLHDSISEYDRKRDPAVRAKLEQVRKDERLLESMNRGIAKARGIITSISGQYNRCPYNVKKVLNKPLESVEAGIDLFKTLGSSTSQIVHGMTDGDFRDAILRACNVKSPDLEYVRETYGKPVVESVSLENWDF